MSIEVNYFVPDKEITWIVKQFETIFINLPQSVFHPLWKNLAKSRNTDERIKYLIFTRFSSGSCFLTAIL